MRQPFTFTRAEGTYNRQAHCDVPKGLYEREHARDGFFGPASHILHAHKPTDWIRWEGPLRPRCCGWTRFPGPTTTGSAARSPNWRSHQGCGPMSPLVTWNSTSSAPNRTGAARNSVSTTSRC